MKKARWNILHEPNTYAKPYMNPRSPRIFFRVAPTFLARSSRTRSSAHSATPPIALFKRRSNAPPARTAPAPPLPRVRSTALSHLREDRALVFAPLRHRRAPCAVAPRPAPSPRALAVAPAARPSPTRIMFFPHHNQKHENNVFPHHNQKIIVKKKAWWHIPHGPYRTSFFRESHPQIGGRRKQTCAPFPRHRAR